MRTWVICLLILVGALLLFGIWLSVMMIPWSFPVDMTGCLSVEGERRRDANRQLSGWSNTIFATFYAKDKIPQYVFDMFAAKAPNHRMIVYDDDEAEVFIRANYTDAVVQRFHTLKGAHKADLIRFCWLYVMGGWYIDIKTILIAPLDDITPKPNQVIAIRGHLYPFLGSHIGVLYGAPGTPLFGNMIQRIIRTPVREPSMNYLTFCMQFAQFAVPECQPSMVWMTESCDPSNCKALGGADRYGMCCMIRHATKGVVMHSRDRNYPYK